MNFYEFYILLKENTVSQELKKTQKEYSKQFIDNIINKIIYRINELFHQNLNSNSKTILAKWIAYVAVKKKDLKFSDVYPNMQHLTDYVDDGSMSRLSTLMNIGVHFLSYVRDFLLSNIDQNGNLNPQLASKFNDSNFYPINLNNLNDEYHQKLKEKQKIGQGRPGKLILKFSDGYSWVDLERSYCNIESETMGHCGNAGSKPGDSILSLRDAQNRPHLTFILNNGVLGEMKGRANDKPVSRYHNYIIELLKLPIIKKVKGGGYRPKNNFKLSDLNDDQRKNLFITKPALEVEYYKEQIRNKKKVSKELLIKITSEEFDYEIFPILAKDINTPPEVLINLSKYDDLPLLIDVAKNENSPKEAIINIEKSHWIYDNFTTNDEQEMQKDLIFKLARNINTSPEFLEMLASEDPGTNRYSKNFMTKVAVASNSNTPIKVLQKISREEKGDIKYFADLYLATHKALNDKNPDIRAKLAKKLGVHPSGGFFKKLSKDINPIVRAAVASNPKTPTIILEELSEDKDLSVRIAIASNREANLSNDTLEKLSNDKNYEVRLTLATRTWLPDIILNKLLNDDNKDVRNMAKINKESI